MRPPETRNRGARLTEALINGMRNVIIENKSVRVRINADLGADIAEFLYKPLDIDAMWRSPLPEIPFGAAGAQSPKHVGFAYYYEGGWQELFPHASRPVDAFGTTLPQHGEAWGLPWEYQIERDLPDEVSVTFRLWTRLTPFCLERTITLTEDQSVISIDEAVKNLGETELSFIWGHHPAFGEPFLDDSCTLSAPARILYDGKEEYSWPPQDKVPIYHEIPPRGSECGAMVYFLELDSGRYDIQNNNLGLTFRMSWDKEVFPYIWVWQEFNSAKGSPWFGRAYAMAVEPVSSLPFAREEGGKMLSISPGQTIETTLEAGFAASQ